jgi:hypothetical protein
MNLAERCHFVNIMPPGDTAGGIVCPVFDMEGYSHCTIVIQIGASASDAGTFTVEQCNALSPSVHPDFAFQYYAEETDAGDVIEGPTRAVAADGIDLAPGGVNNIMYVVEIDASELTSGYHHLRCNFTTPGAANVASAVAILSGARDARTASPTVLT